MIASFFLEQVAKNLPFIPTTEQETALKGLNNFLFDANPNSLFVLKGYAGTGKSSLVGAFVKTMSQMKQPAVLLAPTGRAAKVFAHYAGQDAFTIHKKIYHQKVFSDAPAEFLASANLLKHTLFIVDEASMISNANSDNLGSGRLLDDLIRYVYNHSGCRLLLLGDTAQLPPVSQAESPALNLSFLEGYGLDVQTFTLKQVVRQAENSGILANATRLRQAIENGRVNTYPRIETSNRPDIIPLNGSQLADAIETAYDRDGLDETILITRSNKQALYFNNGIRNTTFFREDSLSSGDLLMVVKNNYFWASEAPAVGFIANGDRLEIRRIRRHTTLYDLHFCDLTAFFPDYNLELDVKILIDPLTTDVPNHHSLLDSQLFRSVMEDCAHLPNQKSRIDYIKADPHFNALHVKYAYAITCHKAQGGQWKNVFLDLSYIPQHYLGIEFYRWLYTAFTRATERIYLISPVKEMHDPDKPL